MRGREPPVAWRPTPTCGGSHDPTRPLRGGPGGTARADRGPAARGGGPADRLRPRVAAPGRRLRAARRRGSAAADRAGAHLAHLPDDARVRDRAAARRRGRGGVRRPRPAGAPGPAAGRRARRLVRRGGRRTDRPSRPRRRTPTPSSCWRRRAPRSSGGPARASCSTRRSPSWTSGSGTTAAARSPTSGTAPGPTWSRTAGPTPTCTWSRRCWRRPTSPGTTGGVQRALRTTEALIHGFARRHGWRLPEHYDEDWQPLPEYNSDDRAHAFRPYGVTPGHLLEWSRLCLHLRAALAEAAPDWLLTDARALFDTAVRDGWAVDGADGFVYTIDCGRRAGRPATLALGARRGPRCGVRHGPRDGRRGLRRVVPAVVGVRRSAPARPGAGVVAARAGPAERAVVRHLVGQARRLPRAAGDLDPAAAAQPHAGDRAGEGPCRAKEG